jgi:hypothetical protein
MKKLIVLVLLAAVVTVLAVKNPTVADYREHVRRQQGLAGTLDLALADLLSLGEGGIGRDNYWVASRFYRGGTGVLPRQDLAWGFAGIFWDLSEK